MITIFTDASGTLREYWQAVALEGVTYAVRLSWNTRTEGWYLSLYLADADRTPIAEGRLIVPYVDLLRAVTHTSRPPGQLVAIPLDGILERPGLTGLGSRVKLVYRTADEVSASG